MAFAGQLATSLNIYLIIFSFILSASQESQSFKNLQLSYPRVKSAYDSKEKVLKKYFDDAGLSYIGFHLFLRVFKKEKTIEAWVKEKRKDDFTLLHTYSFCASSGTLGPKRKEGYLQIPEGVYEINHFNPQSSFYLSLGINYPNASDRKLGDPKAPGGSIYIHGNCVTIGCIPITDDKIKELYLLAVEARNSGQARLPVYIFPDRLDQDSLDRLTVELSTSRLTKDFWKNLQVVYEDFEKTKKLRDVGVTVSGMYFLK